MANLNYMKKNIYNNDVTIPRTSSWLQGTAIPNSVARTNTFSSLESSNSIFSTLSQNYENNNELIEKALRRLIPHQNIKENPLKYLKIKNEIESLREENHISSGKHGKGYIYNDLLDEETNEYLKSYRENKLKAKMEKRKQWDMSDLYYYTKEGPMITPQMAISSAVAAATASNKTPLLKYHLSLPNESDLSINEQESKDTTISDQIGTISNDKGDVGNYKDTFIQQYSFEQEAEKLPYKKIINNEKKKNKMKKSSAKKKGNKKEKDEKHPKNKQKEIRENKKKMKKVINK